MNLFSLKTYACSYYSEEKIPGATPTEMTYPLIPVFSTSFIHLYKLLQHSLYVNSLLQLLWPIGEIKVRDKIRAICTHFHLT